MKNRRLLRYVSYAVDWVASRRNTALMSENDERIDLLRTELRRNLASNTQRLRRSKGERENRKISQEKAALESKIDRTMISKIERARTNLTLDTLIRLADYLEVSVADLLQEATK